MYVYPFSWLWSRPLPSNNQTIQAKHDPVSIFDLDVDIYLGFNIGHDLALTLTLTLSLNLILTMTLNLTLSLSRGSLLVQWALLVRE